MQANDVLKEMIVRRGLSARKASTLFGRSIGYVGRMRASHSAHMVTTLAELADKLDFELILRDKLTGDEIIIDPPTDSDEK